MLSQKYCRYKWEAYCGTSRRHAVVSWRCIAAFPFLQCLEARKAWHCGLGVPEQCPLMGKGKWGCAKYSRTPTRERETGGDEAQSVPSPEKHFKHRIRSSPEKKKNPQKQGIRSSHFFLEGCLPSCWPHSAGYTRTFAHPHYPLASFGITSHDPNQFLEQFSKRLPD